ncbi:hypothetical protein F8388_001670 [Cannabis sativa]|uniref:Uncharacterized protein n=1 Tax=Cannabis sativa TaxID=3483 RepID=A0A7J6HJ38_CANSA|nr:hypothetical protein F8388_001670 [Cannabis sativa]
MTGLWMHFDLDKVVNVLQSDGYLRKPAEHCLSVFGQKLIEGLDTGSVWKLDEKKVCVHFAKQILKGGKKKMESFIEWKKKIPEALPSTPAERFSFLFKEGLKWEWKDLQPYTSGSNMDLIVPGLSSEGLLLKYTRRTQPNADAEPVLGAR